VCRAQPTGASNSASTENGIRFHGTSRQGLLSSTLCTMNSLRHNRPSPADPTSVNPRLLNALVGEHLAIVSPSHSRPGSRSWVCSRRTTPNTSSPTRPACSSPSTSSTRPCEPLPCAPSTTRSSSRICTPWRSTRRRRSLRWPGSSAHRVHRSSGLYQSGRGQPVRPSDRPTVRRRGLRSHAGGPGRVSRDVGFPAARKPLSL